MAEPPYCHELSGKNRPPYVDFYIFRRRFCYCPWDCS